VHYEILEKYITFKRTWSYCSVIAYSPPRQQHVIWSLCIPEQTICVVVQMQSHLSYPSSDLRHSLRIITACSIHLTDSSYIVSCLRLTTAVTRRAVTGHWSSRSCSERVTSSRSCADSFPGADGANAMSKSYEMRFKALAVIERRKFTVRA
jgi:hypothetical protein